MALGPSRGLGFAIAARRAGIEVLEEGAEVRSFARLELPCQPHQLARVRPALAAVVPEQGRQVVAEGGGGALDQSLQAALGGSCAQAGQHGREADERARAPRRDQDRRLGVAPGRRARLDEIANEPPDMTGPFTLLIVPPDRRLPQQP